MSPEYSAAGATRRIEEQSNDQYVLREEPVAYNSVFDHQKRLLSTDNSYLLGFNTCKSDG